MISIHLNQLMVEHYQEILYVSEHKITIIKDHKQIEIHGRNLCMKALEEHELHIEGEWKGLYFIDET